MYQTRINLYKFIASGFIVVLLNGCSNAAPPQVPNPITDTIRTRSIAEPEPSPGAKTLPTPNLGTDIGKRDFKGNHQDSIKTAANPYYKGDNSDTGLQYTPTDMGQKK